MVVVYFWWQRTQTEFKIWTLTVRHKYFQCVFGVQRSSVTVIPINNISFWTNFLHISEAGQGCGPGACASTAPTIICPDHWPTFKIPSWHIQVYICKTVMTKDPATPQMHRYTTQILAFKSWQYFTIRTITKKFSNKNNISVRLCKRNKSTKK